MDKLKNETKLEKQEKAKIAGRHGMLVAKILPKPSLHAVEYACHKQANEGGNDGASWLYHLQVVSCTKENQTKLVWSTRTFEKHVMALISGSVAYDEACHRLILA